MTKFKLTEIQAKAILEMRLQTLAGLERKKIEDELKEKLDFIDECKAILASTKKVLKIVDNECEEIIKNYGDARRTEVVPHAVGEFSAQQLIPDEPMIVTLTKEGYIKRLQPSVYRTQGRGGKGIIGLETKEEDETMQLLNTRTHNTVLYFTTKGRVFRLPVWEIPQGSRTARGQAIVNLLQLQPGEKVSVMIDDAEKGSYLFMATNRGTVKKTKIEDFKNVRKSGLIAIKLRDNDLLEWVRVTSANDQVMLATREGMGIRFKEDDVRPMGRPSMGVRGIRLKGSDEVVSMDVVHNEEGSRLLVVMENGLSKSTDVTEYRFQTRGGTGVKTAQITPKTGKIIGARILDDKIQGDLILISKQGQMIRMPVSQIPSIGRATQGVIIMRLDPGDKVASLTLLETEEAVPASEKAPELPIE
jgi:DNA gyrase subunit A